MKDFLAAIWGELGGRYGEIRLLGKGGLVAQRWATSLDEAEQIVAAESTAFDIFFGVLPRLSRHGGGDAVPEFTDVLWADFDGKAFDATHGLERKFAAFNALRSIAPEPQVVVDTGGGYHGYWLLRDDVPFDAAREVMRGFTIVAGADKTYDKSRILRVPGTLNHKYDPPAQVRILRFDLVARRHRIADFVGYADAAQPPRPKAAPVGETTGWNPSTDQAPKFGEGGRNNGLTQLAGIMFARGMNEDEVLAALEWENSVRCDPPLIEREVESIVRSVSRYAR